METSLGFGSLTAERGVSNLMDACPFQISNLVAVAISRSKVPRSREGASVADTMTNGHKCLLISQTARRSSTFSGCFRGCLGALSVNRVKGRVERPGGGSQRETRAEDFSRRRPPFFRASGTDPRSTALTSNSAASRSRARGEGRSGRRGAARRVLPTVFYFQTREAGCASRGPNRARCASR